MQLPCTTEDRVAFTPPSLAGRDPAPVVYLPYPTGREWAFFLAEVTAAGLVEKTERDLVEVLAEVADRDAPAPEIAAQTQAFCEQWEECVEKLAAIKDGGDVSPDLLEQWKRVNQDLARLSVVFIPCSPSFAVTAAARVRFRNEAPIIAAECFVRGWEHVLAPNGNGEPAPLAFAETRQHKVDPAVFTRLERALGSRAILEIGRRAMALHTLDGQTGKD